MFKSKIVFQKSENYGSRKVFFPNQTSKKLHLFDFCACHVTKTNSWYTSSSQCVLTREKSANVNNLKKKRERGKKFFRETNLLVLLQSPMSVTAQWSTIDRVSHQNLVVRNRDDPKTEFFFAKLTVEENSKNIYHFEFSSSGDILLKRAGISKLVFCCSYPYIYLLYIFDHLYNIKVRRDHLEVSREQTWFDHSYTQKHLGQVHFMKRRIEIWVPLLTPYIYLGN